MPVTPVLGSTGEVASTTAAEVGSTTAAEVGSTTAAEVGSTTAAEVASTTAAVAATAAATCKRIGGNASASHRHGGNDERDSVQRKFLHDSFLSG
jgi:hypothetical protein